MMERVQAKGGGRDERREEKKAQIRSAEERGRESGERREWERVYGMGPRRVFRQGQEQDLECVMRRGRGGGGRLLGSLFAFGSAFRCESRDNEVSSLSHCRPLTKH